MSNMKDKVTKLLAMARDGRGNEHEAEAAMRMAEALMRKHNIELADIESQSGVRTEYNWRTLVVPLGPRATGVNRAPLWLSTLAVATGKFTDCSAVYKQTSQYGKCIRFAGDEHDVEYCAYLFKMFRDTGYRLAKQECEPRHRPAFRNGFSKRLSERMRALKKETQQALMNHKTSTGTALAIVERKLVLRDEHFGEVKTRRARFSTSTASTGWQQGQRAADNVSFGRPLASNSGPRFLK